MLELDGSEGGGQVLRSALALSALTGQPFTMENVRGGRSTPGLGPQHAAAVRAAAAACDARVEDAEVGSEAVTFRPDAVRGGDIEVDVGTAGSATLVCDTVLPLAARTDRRLALTVRGGTDVKWAPPVDYYRRVKLPLLARFGLDAEFDLHRRGFYPEGGGEVRLRLDPSSLAPLDLTDRGDHGGVRIYSVASDHLADADVAERQADAAAEGLAEAGLGAVERDATYVESDSPGSALVVRSEYERTLAGFDALGEKGKPAEEVAGDAVAAALAFHGGPGAVDRHMADQLLVFLALAGGRVAIPRATDHVRASLALLDAFGFDLETDARDDGAVVVAGDGERPF